MEEARKREDNLSENSQQVKVSRVCSLIGLYDASIRFKFTFTSTSSFSCSEGHSASEGGAHRGAGGGPERERSDHC